MQGHMLLSVFALALAVTWVPVESNIFSHLVHHVENELHDQEQKLEDHVKNELHKTVTHIETEAEKKVDDLGNNLQTSLDSNGLAGLGQLAGPLLQGLTGSQEGSGPNEPTSLDSTRQLQQDVIKPVVHIPREDSGCQCVEYNCGCCAYADVPKIHLDDTVCVNVSYLPTVYGVSLTITVDNHVIFNSTVSASNPPPICAGVPYLEKEASICVELYNLDVTGSTFSGCAKLEVRLYGILLEDYDLGCFQMPLGQGQYHFQGDEIRLIK